MMSNQGPEKDPASQQRAALREQRGGVEDERVTARRTPNKPETIKSSGPRRVTRLQDSGVANSTSSEAENKVDRVGALPPELFEAVVGNINDAKDLVNLSMASKSYQKSLRNTVKDIRHRRFTREAAAAIFDDAISNGIPNVTWQDTIPELMGDNAQPHAATAVQLGRAVGPIIQFLDKDRQEDFAKKIIAANDMVRVDIIGGMRDHMASFDPESRMKIFDSVIEDFRTVEFRFNIASTLEDATWRGDLTRQQLDRVVSIRMANPDAELDYEETVRRGYGSRLDCRHHQISGTFTKSTGLGAPYGVKMTTGALKNDISPAGKLVRFAEVSEQLAADAITARGDVVAARQLRATRHKPDGLREGREELMYRLPAPEQHTQSLGRSHHEDRNISTSMQLATDSMRQNIVRETTDRSEEYDTDIFDDVDLDGLEKSARAAMAIRGKNAGSSPYGLDDRSDERRPAARSTL